MKYYFSKNMLQFLEIPTIHFWYTRLKPSLLCGVAWSGVEWSGVDWGGVGWGEWSGVEWSEVEWNGVEWSGHQSVDTADTCKFYWWPQSPHTADTHRLQTVSV